MTLSDLSKNSASFTNQSKSSNNLIRDDADFTWDESAPESTWDNPIKPLVNQTENTASFINLTKN